MVSKKKNKYFCFSQNLIYANLLIIIISLLFIVELADTDNELRIFPVDETSENMPMFVQSDIPETDSIFQEAFEVRDCNYEYTDEIDVINVLHGVSDWQIQVILIVIISNGNKLPPCIFIFYSRRIHLIVMIILILLD